MSVKWLTAIIGILNLVLLGVGAYLANNLRRQLQMKIVDRRLDSYAHLWDLMKVAGPWKKESGLDLISARERKELYDSMTDWYFDCGNGMLLAPATREIYLTAKFNLSCDDKRLRPPELMGARPQNPQERERWRGKLSMSQLSLLRHQMRIDMAINAKPYKTGPLGPEDRMFLKEAGVDLRKKPWKASVSGSGKGKTQRDIA